MNLDIITKQDLNDFKEDLIKEISSLVEDSTNKEWLRSSEVMEMLSISSGTLQNLRINRDIPFTKMGGTLYYERAAVVKALNKSKAA
tara:strand:+ start:206 stop:466 length:261 start_codon:yes stop_codon:yes gene_type:complete